MKLFSKLEGILRIRGSNRCILKKQFYQLWRNLYRRYDTDISSKKRFAHEAYIRRFPGLKASNNEQLRPDHSLLRFAFLSPKFGVCQSRVNATRQILTLRHCTGRNGCIKGPICDAAGWQCQRSSSLSASPIGGHRENESFRERNRGHEGCEGSRPTGVPSAAEDCICSKSFQTAQSSQSHCIHFYTLCANTSIYLDSSTLRITMIIYQAEKKRMERVSKSLAERTIDAQRASATVPR